MGWLGLLAYIAWMGLVLWDLARLIKRSRAGPAIILLFMLLGLMANGLVEYNLCDTELIFIYAMIMGSAASLLRAGEQEKV